MNCKKIIITYILLWSCSAQSVTMPSEDTIHGWEFMANGPVNVTHLGLYDHFYLQDFSFDHEIGLFDADTGDLLVSGWINVGGEYPLIGGYRAVDTPDITLTTGNHYVIAYSNPDGGDVNIFSDQRDGASYDSSITYITSRLIYNEDLIFPTILVTIPRLSIGFIIDDRPAVNLANLRPVPEIPIPATIWLFTSGLILLAKLGSDKERMNKR